MTTTTDRLSRAVLVAVLAFMVAVGLSVVSATSAEAAHHSNGRGQVFPNQTCAEMGYTNPTRYALYKDGKKSGSGHVLVYYSRSRQSNCIVLINTTGRTQQMSVTGWIYTGGGSPGGGWDRGRYSQYAGSVVLRGTANNCIGFSANIGNAQRAVESAHC